MTLCSTKIERGTDRLAVVQAPLDSKITLSQIAKVFTDFSPDNASVILVFHTADKIRVLGGLRDNPALKQMPGFPKQINVATGGRYTSADLPYRAAIVDRVKAKMFLHSKMTGDGEKAQETLLKLCGVIENGDGWEDKVCVHTDEWGKGENDRMCVLSAVKHIECSNEDLTRITSALSTIMQTKRQEGAKPYELIDFDFVELGPIIENSMNSYRDAEAIKAQKAFDKFGSTVAVTFNDLAVATLHQNGALKSRSFARLTL